MSEVETGSCHGFFEWLFIVLGTVFAVIYGVIIALPEIINLLIYLFVGLGYILFSIYILIFSFSTDGHVKTILNYRIEFDFFGFNILMPPIWCFYILIGGCLIFWTVSPDLMG